MFENMTMYQAVRKAALEYPKGVAIHYRGTNISYKKFLKLIDATADIFYNTLGIRENDTILVAQPNMPETMIIFYALNKIGAVSNFVHPFTPFNQIQAIIKKTNTKYSFLFEQRIAKEVDAYREVSEKIYVTRIEDYLPFFPKFIYHNFMNNKIRKKLGRWRYFKGFNYFHNLKPTGKGSPTAEFKKGKCTVLLHSGSTTGDPKTICHSDDAFNYIAGICDKITCLTPKKLEGTMMLAVLPSFHGFGLAMTMHCPLACKMGICMVPKFTPKQVNKDLSKTKFKFACGVPTMYEKLFAYTPFLKNKNFKNIRACYCGGDALKTSERDRINQLFRDKGSIGRVLEGYGLTECIAVNCVNTNDNHKYGSIGLPLEGAEFKIVDQNNKELPRNSLGEIVIRSGSIMLGYYQDEKTTNATIKDGWLHTGDLGSMDEDGYIYFKSRIKRVVKVSGVAVFPSEIERLIESMPQVKKASAIEIPDAKLQSAIKVFVIADYFDEEGMRREILDTCRKYLIRWAVPKEIEFRKELPLTKLSKVDYRALQEEENKKYQN